MIYYELQNHMEGLIHHNDIVAFQNQDQAILENDFLPGISVWQQYDELSTEHARSQHQLHSVLPKKAEAYRHSWQKNAFEIAASGVGTIPAFVLSGLMGLAVYLEDGNSPFYLSKRIGENGKDFYVWKVRTMVPDADKCDQQLITEYNITGNDPRLTRPGKFIRILGEPDELPQVIQIFLMKIGILPDQMDLVSPNRAISEKALKELQRRADLLPHGQEKQDVYQWITQYPTIKPGLFAANSTKRGDEENGKKDDMDRASPGLWFTKNQNLELDLAILTETLTGLSKKAARKTYQALQSSVKSFGTRLFSRNKSETQYSQIPTSQPTPEITPAGD